MEEIGEVFQYYSHIGVAAVKLVKELKVGDRIRIQGHTTNFEQNIKSIQIEHKVVQKAKSGSEVGIKVDEKVRRHDKIYTIE